MSAKYVLNTELFYSIPVIGRRFSDFRLLPTEFSILKQCHFYAFILIFYVHLQSTQCSNINGDTEVKRNKKSLQ